ncbi:hypothetical protein SDRG_04565 [Saprolegnia diclina VS20]|uniref:MPN domain-containing protein n=1 Tax=Saprolegnia diclina (strain VS20) TaxID=1156394 RepID=T0QVS8_SAPDV|nr:hypothetical protein SDRG_04565 [Saprolegnia diclina VS20]EQC38135.1 hypothetical protein SDRG_04565 [Saprolegnia diclina VS20]|eukprot:XP_008608462.1 hypothetical protein SDRG_04565 [Saprolegnia diclina VS20]
MAYRVSEDAQVVMGLHAAQYPHLSVTGLLVGRDSGEGIEITKAFPVAHQAPTAPFLEFASLCVEAYAAELKLKIVGMYVANARADDVSLGPVHTRIANTVEAQSTRACALVLDNRNLATPRLLLKDVKKGWIEMEKRIAFEDDHGKVLQRALTQSSLSVVDFDAHLEQPATKDWRNTQVLSLARLQV